MLDRVPNQACAASNHRMPVDFTSYLLAASPPTPSSGYDLLSYAFSNKNSAFTSDKYVFDLDQTSKNTASLNSRRNGPLKPIIIKQDLDEGIECPEDTGATSPVSPGRARKQVSFADHKGMALATVRFLTDPSDVPPRLKPEILASLTQGAQAGASVYPPLKLCFTQPASDYLKFRDHLEKHYVSLENVILKDYAVAGTIKVKNISFEKRVFLRHSCDSWESFEDIEGSYVPGPGETSHRGNIYDTFSFEFQMSTNFGLDKKVQFAVCYEANNSQYWDNNSGTNYEIVSANFKEEPVQLSCVRNGAVTSWTKYACWNHMDNTTPYW